MPRSERTKSFAAFAWRSIVVHTVTYFVFGGVGFLLFDYTALWQRPIMRDLYRPLDSARG